MSFDVFIQTTDKNYSFSRSIVEEAFRPYSGSFSADRMQRLSFPGGGSSDLYVSQKPMINGFSVMAAGGDALYDAIYQVLRRVPHLYMYWSGGSVVADPAVILELPEGLIEAFGPPSVVRSGQDIIEAIERGP
jgi:hypothetical protein